jgi:hypothetical protein
MKPFSIFELTTACLSEQYDARFPTALHAWRGTSLKLPDNGTHFGYIFRGGAILRCQAGEFVLQEKMYFCMPGRLQLENGEGIIITRLDYKGLFNLGGPIESQGRLRYIDGCTDTLLISPILQGKNSHAVERL